MTIGRLLAPLRAATTYRRAVFLLLGAVVALPYVLLAGTLANALVTGSLPRPTVGFALVAVLVIGGAPALLSGTRQLQIAAVRGLLQVDLPDPPSTMTWEARARSALWFGLHLIGGAFVGTIMLVAVPLALALVDVRSDWWSGLGLAGVGIGVLLAVGYAVAGLGALAALMAPVLLGPSPAERIATAEGEARRLAERNRLARELHDSIGHVLTMTVLQAAAARQSVDIDPDFTRRALTAIEEAGRAAMDDLDAALRVLRGAGDATVRPKRTLADLGRLVAETRAAGRRLTLTVTGAPDRVAAAVSREGYRIVQESVTNAVRHNGPVAVRVAVAASATHLTIEVTNPVEAGPPAPPGRGITGMRERVTLLGGTVTAGSRDGIWRVTATLPVVAVG